MLRTRTSRVAAATGLAAASAFMTAGPASAETEVDRPDSFTSAFTSMATPDTIINTDGDSVPGEEGATGTFTFMINSDEEIICYDITLDGVTPPYESMAKTATHVHEAAAGSSGPPRLAFPDPTQDGDVLRSEGCLKGPFTTGLEGDDGNDTGQGFTLSQIEANPAGFSADTHTADFVPGAVRGQLTPIPVGGVDTGMGGTSEAGSIAGPVALAAGLGLAAAGAVALRRRVGA